MDTTHTYRHVSLCVWASAHLWVPSYNTILPPPFFYFWKECSNIVYIS